MTLVEEKTAVGMAGVESVKEITALGVIKQSDVAAAILERQLQPSFVSWIETLDPKHLPCGRIVLPKGGMQVAVTHLCEMAGMAECLEHTQLINDVTVLAETFAEVMEAKYLRLRLDAVTTNACRKFHMDALTTRLVCTYRGTGTQYGFAETGFEPDPIYTVQTGSPILLRGSLWPPQLDANFLHRSPPIEGTGETRLVLVLDPIDDLEHE